MRRPLAALFVAALVLALPACGDKKEEASGAATLAPANALGYVSLDVDPDDSQKEAVADIVGRFPEAPDTWDEIVEEMSATTAETEYEADAEDFLAFLGSETAAVLVEGETENPTEIFLVQVRDKDRAEAFAKDAQELFDERREEDEEFEFSDTEYRAVFVAGEYFVDITAYAEDDLESVRKSVEQLADGNGESLADVDRVNDLLGEVSAEGFAEAYFDFDRLAAQSAKHGGEDFSRLELGAGAGIARAEKDLIVWDLAGDGELLTASGDPKITKALPGDSLLAFTVFDVAAGASRLFDQEGGDESKQVIEEFTGLDLDDDILSWMDGETVAVVGAPSEEFFASFYGGGVIDAGVVVEVTDADAARDALPSIVDAVSAQSGVVLEPFEVSDGEGFVAAEPLGDGYLPAVVLTDELLVVATTQEYAETLLESGDDTLAEAEGFERSLTDVGDDTTSLFVFQFAPLIAAYEQLGEEDTDGFDSLHSFGARAWKDGALTRAEFRLVFQ